MFNDQQRPTDKLNPTQSGDTVVKAKDNVAQLTTQMEIEDDDEYCSLSNEFTTTREGFVGLYKSMQEAGQKPEANGALHPSEYPGVDLMPNGDVFGSYDDLDAYLKSQELSGPRGAEVMGFESHHLIENHWMQTFGFSRGEAPCVAVYADEHMQLAHGEEGIAMELPRTAKLEGGEKVSGVLYDIDTLVEGHTKVYQEIGRPEWAERLRGYVRNNRDRIIAAYENGTVSWATPKDVARIKKYLQSL